MMNQIKHGFSFVLGFLYCLTIVGMSSPIKEIQSLCLTMIFIESVIYLIPLIWFFAANWNCD